MIQNFPEKINLYCFGNDLSKRWWSQNFVEPLTLDSVKKQTYSKDSETVSYDGVASKIADYIWKEHMRHSPDGEYALGYLDGIAAVYKTLKYMDITKVIEASG